MKAKDEYEDYFIAWKEAGEEEERIYQKLLKHEEVENENG